MGSTDAMRVVAAFNEVWGARDLEGSLAMLTDDCVFDATGPAPDGELSRGRDEIRVAWRAIFDDSSNQFEVEEMFGSGDRVVQRWRYSWGDGHVRGVDLFRIVDGRIAEKLAYVKG